MLSPALPLNFDEPPAPPDWLVDGLIERDTVTVVSADSGVGKSVICNGLTVAIIQGQPWLDRETHGERVVVIDEENYKRVIKRRLQAFGMTNDDRPNLRYFNRLGIALGEGDWFEKTEATLAHFAPDLLIIDTAAAATAVDVNDNTAVARFYAKVLRPFTEYCAVLLLHHERKPPAAGAGKRHAGHAMMGARQWAGQSDAHIALERVSDIEEERLDDGRLRKRYQIRLEQPKSRDGKSVDMHISLVSEHESDGDTLRWMRLELDDGPVDARLAKQAEWAAKVEAIIGAHGGSMMTGELAAAMGTDPENGSFKRAMRKLNEDGRVSRPEHGVWSLPPPQDAMPF